MRTVRLLSKASYHEEEADSEGTWALSYGDMITLLLSFFVIFFTTDPKQVKLEKMNRHLTFQLENLVPAVMPLSSETGQGPKVKMPLIPGLNMRAHEVGESIVVTFQDTSFYNSGAIVLKAQGEKLLNEFAEKYLPYAGNYRLAIKGFTDKRKVVKRRNTFKKYDDNLELSVLRSVSAMRVLQQAGVPLNRMEIAGAGELELIDRVLPRKEGLTEEELNSYSRTIVLVIQPVKESW
jgi:flagellar motor protein MotB